MKLDSGPEVPSVVLHGLLQTLFLDIDIVALEITVFKVALIV